jgi:diacylglycerol O-acyltransferase
VNGGSVPADEFSRFLPEITAFTERLRFNVPYRGPQKFAWADISLTDVKAIGHARGASVNDVLLALVTATVRRYSELHGDPVKGKLLRLMVPVNLRGTENTSELGNRISLVPVTIPLNIRNPLRLLSAVHKRTEFVKHAHTAELVSLAGGMLGMFPGSLQALVGPMLSRLPMTPFNLVCTNVPGPQFPLYLIGHKMLSWYPYVPIGGEMAMNCAILSYNGSMYFGFSGDVHAAPDLSRLETLLKSSFDELCEAVRTGPPIKEEKKAIRKKRITASKATVPGAKVAPIADSVPVQHSPVEAAKKKEPPLREEHAPTQLIA